VNVDEWGKKTEDEFAGLGVEVFQEGRLQD